MRYFEKGLAIANRLTFDINFKPSDNQQHEIKKQYPGIHACNYWDGRVIIPGTLEYDHYCTCHTEEQKKENLRQLRIKERIHDSLGE